MKKNIYVKPESTVVRLQQQHIICTSVDANGMNKSLQQTEEVNEAWVKKSHSVWDEDWSE